MIACVLLNAVRPIVRKDISDSFKNAVPFHFMSWLLKCTFLLEEPFIRQLQKSLLPLRILSIILPGKMDIRFL